MYRTNIQSNVGDSACSDCADDSESSADGKTCVCSQGYTGDDNNGAVGVCQACAKGTYKALAGSAVCNSCPSDSKSLSHSVSPTDCICNGGFFMENNQCKTCAAGTHKESPGNDPAPCVTCPENHFSLAGGLSWSSCDGNARSPVGSESSASCSCNPGFTGHNGDTCTECGAGTFKSAGGDASCAECPDHSNSLATSLQQTDCQCDPGFTGPDGGPCHPCPADTYKSALGSSDCEGCPANTNSSAQSTSQDGCQCSSGFEPKDSVCQQCVAPKFKAVGGPQSCANYNSSKHTSGSDFTHCICKLGLAGFPKCQQVVRTLSLARTEPEFLEQKPAVDKALARAYGVHADNVTTSIATRRRHFLQSDSVRITATIAMGETSVSDDTEITNTMSDQGFTVVLESLSPDEPVKATEPATFIGRILSRLPFGDGIPLVIMLFSLCLCFVAVCVCIRTLTGASVCYSCSTHQCLRKTKIGCMWYKCTCTAIHPDSDDESGDLDAEAGAHVHTTISASIPVTPSNMRGYHSCPT